MTTQAIIGPISGYNAREVGERLTDLMRDAFPLCKTPIPVVVKEVEDDPGGRPY